jgi:hypothetical protein
MDEESAAQAQRWAEDVSAQVIDWAWRGFDQLRDQHLNQVDFEQPLEQLERDLTSKHFISINQLWAMETGGFSSISPHHEYPENETRPPAPGRPPAYDLAFVWVENQRVAWPIEAKVVQTPKAIAAYVGDVEKFLGGTAAPLTGRGGLIAYLLAGEPAEFFDELQAHVHAKLEIVPAFQARAHRLSHHQRNQAPPLCLHHMSMMCTRSTRPKN